MQANVVRADVKKLGHLPLRKPNRLILGPELDLALAVFSGVENQVTQISPVSPDHRIGVARRGWQDGGDMKHRGRASRDESRERRLAVLPSTLDFPCPVEKRNHRMMASRKRHFLPNEPICRTAEWAFHGSRTFAYVRLCSPKFAYVRLTMKKIIRDRYRERPMAASEAGAAEGLQEPERRSSAELTPLPVDRRIIA